VLIGFLSDAHGNPFGLVSCYGRLRSEGAERIYFLGDAVGYWPHGTAVVRELLSWKTPCIKGNHDAMLLGLLPIPKGKESIYRLKPAILSIPETWKRAMTDEWPLRREFAVAGRQILLVHGRPTDSLEGYLYENDPTLPGESEGFDVVVMGHTHHAFIKYEKDVLWLNAGSCGMPRDTGDMASCALYDSVLHTARILRVKIDTGSLLASCAPGSVAPEVIECLDRNAKREVRNLP